MVDIQTRAVKSTIGCHCAQDFADWLDSAFAGSLCTFHDHRCCAHADQQSVPPAIERNGCFFHHFVGGCRAAGQESRAHPIEQMIGSYVIGGDHDHSPAPSGTNPVFRQRYGLGGGSTGRVDLRVGPTGPDEFGEL